ncbi:MAG TPA: T9SS type A sorting domain-containing protein [Bacteroidales bacterium]|nr:T9SS type A sorting domain-containing protein [Bacteroidales bacterium]
MKREFSLIKKYFLIIFVIINYCNEIIAQRNSHIPPPYLWLKADSVNHEQNYWVDLSGHNHHVYFNSPIDSGKINYQPSLKLETTNPFTIPYRPKKKDVICMFAVYKADSAQQSYSIWSVRLDSSKYIEMNSHYVRGLYGTNSYEGISNSPVENFFRHDWINQKIDTLYAHLNICGGDSIKSFNGLIAEILFYNRSLSLKEITQVSTYLAIKYGISLSEINYVRSDNIVLWDVKKNKEFNNEIAGIGKDIKLQINQKQSAGNGGESILKITAGNHFYNLNRQNLYEVNDGDFLIWSDNGKNLYDFNNDTTVSDTSDIPYLNNLSERRWLIKRTGNTAYTIPTMIMLSAPELAHDTTATINLVISPSANTLFPTDSCFIMAADSLDSMGNFYFHYVHWDTDHSGMDAFTFQINEVQQDQQSCLNRSLNTNNPESEGVYTVNVFPNPSSGLVNVHINLTEPGNVSLTVQDESGRVVYNNQLFNEQDYFEKVKLNSKGVYFFNIESKEMKKQIKIVVQ